MAKFKRGICINCKQDNIPLKSDGNPHGSHKCKSTKLTLWGKFIFLILFIFAIFSVIFVVLGNQQLSILFIALTVIDFAYFLSFNEITENDYKRITVSMTVLGIGLALFSTYYSIEALDKSTSALNLAESESTRLIEADQNKQNSLLKSMDTKLSLTAATAKFFSVNKTSFIDGNHIWTTYFPKDFESYITELRISNKSIIKGLIILEEITAQFNSFTELSNQVMLNDVNQVIENKDLWKSQARQVEKILFVSCSIKKNLYEEYGYLPEKPKIKEYLNTTNSKLNADLLICESN